MTRVIVFADRSGSELMPLTDDLPLALLPVAAKPVLVHCLEDLATAGLHAATIVVCDHAEMIEASVARGTRWGLAIDYALSRGEEPPSCILERIGAAIDTPHLLLRGDVVRSPCLANFLQHVSRQPDRALELSLGGKPGQVLYLPNGFTGADLAAVAWPMGAVARSATIAATDIAEGSWHPLDDLPGYHRANLDAAAGRIPGLLLPGRQSAIGLFIGRQSKVSPRSVRRGVALVGSNCRVDSTASLAGEVVVSDQVFIDRDAEIENSVILPNTYIGELVQVRNAIVRGSDLIRVDTGACLKINDSFLIADLGPNGTAAYFARPFGRLAGLLLLLASAPLWPIALVLAMLNNPRHPLTRKVLRGNRIELNDYGIRQRRSFSAWEWACSPRPLRYLPRLLAVVSGDLKLIGSLPVSQQEAAERADEWQREANRAPSGLIGPSLLLLPPDAMPEDIILSDAVYARQRTFGKDLHLVGLALKKLFRRSTWTGN